jgi:hypothetical protein
MILATVHCVGRLSGLMFWFNDRENCTQFGRGSAKSAKGSEKSLNKILQNDISVKKFDFI